MHKIVYDSCLVSVSNYGGSLAMPRCRFGKTVSIRVDVDRECHAALKRLAAGQGVHLKDLILDVLEEFSRANEHHARPLAADLK
jgi:predicted HicB family RNase H-like nuclease